LKKTPLEGKMKRNFLKMLGLTATLALAGVAGATTGPAGPLTDADIAAKAAHEIRMYSRYTIWDNLSVRVVGGNLELLGQVSQPYKKADLQRIVQRVPGVTSVTNEVEVLPLSFNDDNLRLRIARAIYREPALSRYAIQPVPPIHIIVKNGHVTLEGVVNNELEKNVAAMRASSAGLSFGPVQNNLRVENPKKKS
jgi:BON domain